uniref:Uncharacterized protein n=1 Tax=Zea mays TaxID=4577 RepID=A0A804RH28_MAIZE
MTVLMPTNCCATWTMTPAVSPRRTTLLPIAFLSLPMKPLSPMEPSRSTSSSTDRRIESISSSTSFAGKVISNVQEGSRYDTWQGKCQ